MDFDTFSKNTERLLLVLLGVAILLAVLFATGCSPVERIEGAKTDRLDWPNFAYIDRVTDPEYGVVCYVTTSGQAISCMQAERVISESAHRPGFLSEPKE